ncbi:hypothetical protein KZX46_21895 (plasmid) [Polymorphobacter sp. PAMC 29334]|uniref:hypothetical protein n=1 Tax=Polymorphobacter sp. PAMC 29334 TaxID=2862331 RepID=UPI001C787887|nr:hypothetical protein [Polymorphobacter sp. PAMC 29334]QYE37054.1 hypothetical protein KZX46_21895 [Polymorphobacter sp. PAMC 29334]
MASSIEDTLNDVGREAIEHALLEAAPAVLEYGVAIAGFLASVLTTSPVLAENFYRGIMDDGTQVTSVVLTPK